MRKKWWLAFSLVLSLLFIAGCLKRLSNALATKQAKQSFGAYGPIEKYGAHSDFEKMGIVYAPGEPDEKFLTLDVYWNQHEGLQPLVVNIHGGGWIIGDKNQVNSVYRCKYLVSQGYVVVNVNYRLLNKYPIQVQVNDVMGAVIWAKEHAAEFGADPKAVGVMGGSAGGHLAAMVAWASDDDFFVPTGHATSEYDSDVKAAVLFYGVYDLENVITLGNPRLKATAYPLFTKTGEGPARKEILRHISPKYHVRPTLPPSLFICGDKDSFGLYEESEYFEKLLRENNVPTGLHTAHGADHGFDAKYGEPYTKEAMAAMTAWFDKYLKNGSN